MAEFQRRYLVFGESDAIYKPPGAMRGVESAIHRRSTGERGLWLGQMLLVGNGDAIGGIGDAGSGGGVGDALTHASLREKRRGKEARKEARKEGLVEGGKRGLREYGGKAEKTAERNRKLRIETGKSGGYNKPV